jgi:hypothetical protein
MSTTSFPVNQFSIHSLSKNNYYHNSVYDEIINVSRDSSVRTITENLQL